MENSFEKDSVSKYSYLQSRPGHVAFGVCVGGVGGKLTSQQKAGACVWNFWGGKVRDCPV